MNIRFQKIMRKKMSKKANRASTIDSAEVAQFSALADQWWDEDGPFKPLHRLNPARIGYLRDRLIERFEKVEDLEIADIGCGGGLVTEPFARLGADVTGVDASPENIKAAKAHARDMGLSIRYLATTAEKLAAEGKKFDAVFALEIVEHVNDVALFIDSITRLVKPTGLLIMSTLSRTPKSFALGIVAAEYILKWLPRGTHDWKKFLKPSELAAHLADNGFEALDVTGLVYSPLTREFSLSKSDLDVNYFLTSARK